MEQTLATLATFAFGFFLAALPLSVMLSHRNREISNLHAGIVKNADEWYEEVKGLREALYNVRYGIKK